MVGVLINPTARSLSGPIPVEVRHKCGQVGFSLTDQEKYDYSYCFNPCLERNLALGATVRKLLRVAIVWNGNILGDKVFDKPTKVTVGESPKSHLVVPGLGDSFTLFDFDGNSLSLNLSNAMTGKNTIKGNSIDISKQLGGKANTVISVDTDDYGLIKLGEIGLFWQFMVQDEKVPVTPFSKRIDLPMAVIFAIATVVHLSFLFITGFMFEDNPELKQVAMPDRFVRFIVERPKDEKIEKIVDVELQVTDDPNVSKAPPGPKSNIPDDRKMSDKVKNVGIHKALGSNLMSKGALADIFGDRTSFDSRLAVAMDAQGEHGTLGMGSGGLGLRGGGGGGAGFGRLQGMGSLGGSGGGGVGVEMGGRGKAKVSANLKRGNAETAGFCAPADIQRVVQQRSAGIKFCFEKELQRDPSLGGQVVLNWVIALNGTVQSSAVASTTLNNKNVEQCMLQQVRRWRFKEPDGGLCSVNYPFVFSGSM